MDILFKASAGVLIALVLCQLLDKNNKNISVLLAIAVCCIVTSAATQYIEQIFAFFQRIETLGNLNSEILEIMLKAAGIGLLAEITSLICTDAGNGVLGKALQILASAVILWICIPVFTELMTLVENILGAV